MRIRRDLLVDMHKCQFDDSFHRRRLEMGQATTLAPSD